MGFTIDIDTGGTFTDGFFVSGDHVETVKVPTTPHDLTVCFMDCIKAGASKLERPVEDLLYETDILRFSNTIGTNAIIQRDGSKVGLMVTAGRESLAPTSTVDGLSPLVWPDMAAGIEEMTDQGGRVVKSVDEVQVLQTAQQLIDKGARCLVIALDNSEMNPANERLARKVIKNEYPRDFLGSVPVFLASDLSCNSGEAERINAAVINAYIHAKLVRLLYKAGEDLRRQFFRRSLLIGHNNGQVARVAKTRAVNTYNSGPAAGLLGAAQIGRLYDAPDLISMDMGGTSFDLGYVIKGQASYDLRPEVEGLPVNMSMLSIRAIGAGGGSIASVKGDELRVGPQSAGALPGPVCFDLGGQEPTVTDADLMLGILDPDYFLGGSMKLNPDKASQAVTERLAEPLGVSGLEAAWRVKNKVDEAMGRQVANLKQELGFDFTPVLVVYGGAGPAHCCALAKAAGIKKIILTPYSAVFSAFSSSTLDVGHIYQRRVDLPLGEGADLSALAGPLEEMRAEAARDMRGEGFAPEQLSEMLDLQVKAQTGPEEKITAPADFFQSPAGIGAAALQAKAVLGLNGGQNNSLKITVCNLIVQAPVPHYEIKTSPPTASPRDQAVKGTRPVYFSQDKGQVEVTVYDWARLENGHQIKGPALVESAQTTLLVEDGFVMKINQYGHGELEEV